MVVEGLKSAIKVPIDIETEYLSSVFVFLNSGLVITCFTVISSPSTNSKSVLDYSPLSQVSSLQTKRVEFSES